MYVYLFFGETEGSPDDLGGVDGISYLAITTGPYPVVGKVEVEKLSDLKDILSAVHHAGGRAVETAVAIAAGPNKPFPRNAPPGSPAVEAFVQIWVEQGAADDVLGELDELDAVSGLAAVAGDFDVLTVVGGGSVEEVAGILLQGLQQIEGISSTTTSFIVAPIKEDSQASEA